MGYNIGNISKATFQRTIKSKQSLFNRMKRRYKVSNDPSEKRFLKTEAGRLCTELKQCCTQWKNCGFGACTWVTKNFTVTNFCAVRTNSRKRNVRRTTTSNTRRTTSRRPKSRTSSQKRTTARRSYVAW